MPLHFSIGKSNMPDAMKKSIMFDATPLGRQKVQNYEGADTPRFKTLAVVVEEGPMNLEEVSQKAHISQTSANIHLKELIRSQYVRTVTQKGIPE